MTDLSQVIADARGEAQVLRRAGNVGQADYVESLCDRVASSAEDYLRRISLADARLKSGLNVRTIKRRFRELQDCGLAGYNDRGEMWFRACAIPQRAGIAQQRERGRRAVA
jgi:hypothetical protein